MMSVLSMEVILGGLTFTGSLMAAGKLQEILPQRPITYKGQNLVNFLVLAVAVGSAVYLVLHPEAKQLFPLIVGLSLIFGILLIIPIGGADMPTVISLLNGYAGIIRCRHGIRAPEQAADYRRRARRIIRTDSLGHHVEGDEPVVHQRSVWSLRPGAGRSRGRAGGPAGAQRHGRGSGRDPSCRE